MAHTIVMPRLGWTMEEGTFGAWLKEDGEAVAAGDLLFTVESDKATQEVESFEAGILRIAPDGPAPGAIVPVGAVLGYLVGEGEDAPFGEDAAVSTPDVAPEPPPPMPETPATTAAPQTGARTSRPAISPRARRVAA
ncbi:MAG: hypothetical protein KDD83_16765, partial [Caldilineaceae bacterium]|nr:hypothetical protein [Caldilineaceae bacterium]